MSKRIKRQNERIDENSDFVFTLPDLVVEHDLNKIEKTQLEAFKTKANSLILEGNKSDKYGQLHWVSLGHPTLIAFQSEWFHFNDLGFYAFVEMLTEEQKSLFVNEVKRRYNIDIQKRQITTMIVSRYKCEMKLLCNDEMFTLIGKVSETNKFPLRFNFETGKNRKIIEECIKTKLLNGKNNLVMECEAATTAKSAKSNVFSINLSNENNKYLINKMFGNNDTVYVTRNQLDDFS